MLPYEEVEDLKDAGLKSDGSHEIEVPDEAREKRCGL